MKVAQMSSNLRGKNLKKLMMAIELISRPGGATIYELSEKLSITTRSVHRLFDQMHDLNIPIYDDKEPFEKKKKWKLTENYTKKLPNMKVPILELSISELIALSLLKSHKSLYKGTDIERKIDSAFNKIDIQLPDGLSDKLNKIAPLFLPSAQRGKQSKEKANILNQLTSAMLNEQTCKCNYYSFYQEKTVSMTIDPLHIFEHHGGLYLYARNKEYKDIITMAIERFVDIEVTERYFKYPKNFDPTKKLEYAFGIVDNDPIKVKIWFSKKQAKYIKERKWTKTQTITERKDGSIVLSMDTSGMYEIKKWILSHGAEAKVLSPKKLKDEVIRELKSMKKQY